MARSSLERALALVCLATVSGANTASQTANQTTTSTASTPPGPSPPTPNPPTPAPPTPALPTPVPPPTSVPPTPKVPRGTYKEESSVVTLVVNQEVNSFAPSAFAGQLHTAMGLNASVGVACFNVRAGSVLVDTIFYSADGSRSVDELNRLATQLEKDANEENSSLRKAVPGLQGTPHAEDDDDGLSGGAVAAIVICALLFFCILPIGLAAAWYYMQEKKKEDKMTVEAYEVCQEVAAALTQTYGSIDNAVDSAYQNGGAEESDKKSVGVEGVKVVLDASQVGHLYDQFIAILAVENDVTTKDTLLRVLNAGPPSTDAQWERLKKVFTGAREGGENPTCRGLAAALQKDASVMAFREAGDTDARWGEAVVADLEARPEDFKITWDEFRALCKSAMAGGAKAAAEAPADDAARSAPQTQNPLQHMEALGMPEFDVGAVVEALFEGSWFGAAVVEVVPAGANDDLPQGGYTVMWLEDETRTLVRMHEVRASGEAPVPAEEPPVDPAAVDVTLQPEAAPADAAPADAAPADAAPADAAGMYVLDQAVMVNWEDAWHQGKINTVNEDGTHDIDWGDGTCSQNVGVDSIRPIDS
eukprot:TRINITY_DN1614_c0_g1_i1.p1 TRINITY_DN1614_c0_g1~~TRINITY_DN1614_c0_g1_i1.p1  ORF type:complete len:589 (+),score=154.97 TRINITY_DN1614_c0_g1_i1:71-1837(+)